MDIGTVFWATVFTLHLHTHHASDDDNYSTTMCLVHMSFSPTSPTLPFTCGVGLSSFQFHQLLSKEKKNKLSTVLFDLFTVPTPFPVHSHTIPPIHAISIHVLSHPFMLSPSACPPLLFHVVSIHLWKWPIVLPTVFRHPLQCVQWQQWLHHINTMPLWCYTWS